MANIVTINCAKLNTIVYLMESCYMYLYCLAYISVQ